MLNFKKIRALFRPTSELCSLTPLTERNIGYFEFEWDNASDDEFRRSREVHISEWLRLLP